MKITVNGKPVEFAGKTLADLLTHLGRAEAKVATAVNAAFVAAPTRGDKTLQDGDAVEIVAPKQGG